jgi:hypothetical protein
MMDQWVGDTIQGILGTQPLNYCGYFGLNPSPQEMKVFKSRTPTFYFTHPAFFNLSCAQGHLRIPELPKIAGAHSKE